MKTYEKRWIVDIDIKDKIAFQRIIDITDNIRPIGNKIETIIPTKNGFHFITKKFDVMEFKKHYPDVDIQKKNPTLLYYPDSLDIQD
jgi:hypothetical protein